MECSTRRPVSRMRQVVDVPKVQRRDPRFDPLCGKLDETRFKKGYEFVDQLKDQELKMIQEQLRKERDPEEKARLHRLFMQMVS